MYSFHCLGASLIVAIQAVKKGAAAEGMKIRDYVWRGHDPTSVAVMTEVILIIFFTLFGEVLTSSRYTCKWKIS